MSPLPCVFAAQFRNLYHLPGFYEPFSAISHLFGAMLFLLLGARLLWRGRGDPLRLGLLGIYAVSCVLLLALSGVFHMLVRGDTAHAVLGRIEGSAIATLIAGTFTPVHGILFRGRMRWMPLALIWTAAGVTIVLKTVFYHELTEGVSVTFYFVLGWLGAASTALLWRIYGFAFIRPMVLGGLVFSVGGILDFLDWPTLIPGVIEAHDLWHIAVLVGAYLNWRFIWQFATSPVR